MILKDPTGGEAEAVCVLVIDRTSSADDPRSAEKFERVAEATVDGCQEKDAAMSVYYFDQAGGGLQLVNDEPFALYPPAGRSPTKQDAQVERAVADAKAELDDVFSQPAGDSQRSNVLAAYQAAAANLQQLADSEDVSEAYLVMLTDGMQLAPDITVEALSDPDSDVGPLVRRARDFGLIPEVEDVDVTFVGVRTGDTGDPDDQFEPFFEAKVQEFWTQVTEAGGSELCDKAYVPEATRLPVSC